MFLSFPVSSYTSKSKILSWQDINPPFSLYDFRERNNWSSIALKRFLSQLRLLRSQSIIIEEIENFSESRIEDDTLRKVRKDFLLW